MWPSFYWRLSEAGALTLQTLIEPGTFALDQTKPRVQVPLEGNVEMTGIVFGGFLNSGPDKSVLESVEYRRKFDELFPTTSGKLLTRRGQARLSTRIPCLGRRI